MFKNKYQPYETDIIAENLDEISSHNNLNNDSIEQNDKIINFEYNSPKSKEFGPQNNPLLNADTTLKSLRISHSNEKSEESHILINRINGIKSPKNKPIQENESDLYFDMYEILNKENDLNRNNIQNENKNKNKSIANKKIRINNNIKINKQKINNSLRFSNYNNFKNSKISISNKLKTKLKDKNLNSQHLKEKKTSICKKISIQQLFKQQFEERSKNNSQITNKVRQHKYDNYSSPNYFEDSLCKEKTPKEFSTIENSESCCCVNLTYIPQCEVNLNSNEYIRNLFDDHDDDEKHDNDYDDKNVMVSELDINLSPSTAKKKAKKPIIKVKKYNSNDGSSIREYLFKAKKLTKKPKSIPQKNTNIKKDKITKNVKTNGKHVEITTSSLVGFNINKNNSYLNKSKIIYKKITHTKTGFSCKNNSKVKSNYKNHNFSLRDSTKTKTISKEKTECANKINKIKLIKKYFLTHKINSNHSFQANKRSSNYQIINRKNLAQNISNLDNIKLNSKITKKNEIPNCVFKKKNKIPTIKNKNQQSKISYLNIVKRMNSINNKNNTRSLRNFYQFNNSINISRNAYENKLHNNSNNKLNSTTSRNNERLFTDSHCNKSSINSKILDNNNIFKRIFMIKAIKSINLDNNKISVHKSVFRDLSHKYGKRYLFE